MRLNFLPLLLLWQNDGDIVYRVQTVVPCTSCLSTIVEESNLPAFRPFPTY